MIWGESSKRRLVLSLKAVKIPRSTYYYTKHSQGRKYDDDQVIQAIDEIRQTDAKYTQKYGYRRITLVMHEQGFKVNLKLESSETDWSLGITKLISIILNI